MGGGTSSVGVQRTLGARSLAVSKSPSPTHLRTTSIPLHNHAPPAHDERGRAPRRRGIKAPTSKPPATTGSSSADEHNPKEHNTKRVANSETQNTSCVLSTINTVFRTAAMLLPEQRCCGEVGGGGLGQCQYDLSLTRYAMTQEHKTGSRHIGCCP